MLRKINLALKKLHKNEKGFTLIELMVVVAIIGILAAAIIPQFTKAADKSKVARAKAELANFKTVLAMVYAEKGSYPSDWSGMAEYGGPSSAPDDPWGKEYKYSSPSGTDYSITTGDTGHVISVTPSSNPH